MTPTSHNMMTNCLEIKATRTLLKILALGIRQIEDGNVQPVEEVVPRLRIRGKESLISTMEIRHI